MLQPSGRRPTLSQSAAARQASVVSAPRTQAASATATDHRGGDSAATSNLGRSLPAETFVAAGWAAGGAAGGAVGGAVGGASSGPKSRPLAALRPVPPSPPPRSGMPADGIGSSSSTSASGDGSAGDDRTTAARTAGPGGVYGSQASAFVRPPPIVTRSLAGARDPTSPPPRGQHTGPLIPQPGGEMYGGRTDRDEGEEGEDKKRLIMKALAAEAAAVIATRALNPTSLHSSARRAADRETSSRGGGGGGGGGGGSSSTSSYRSDGDSRNEALSLPFRQLIAHHAPSVADRHPSGRPSSPRARVGAVRRGSGCDGMPLTGVRRRGSGSGVDADSIRLSLADRHPAARPSSPRARAGAERRGSGCDGMPLTGVRRRGSGSGISAEIAGDGSRRASGKHLNGSRRGSQSGGGGVGQVRRGSGGSGGGGVRWASGKPLTGVLRRGSGAGAGAGAGDEPDTVAGDGVRWASSKPAINTRPSTAMRSADSYRDGQPDVPKAIAAEGFALAENADDSEGRSRSFNSNDPGHRAARQGSYVARGHAEQKEREGTASPTRALARATARRLSALGAKAVGGISLGGTGIISSNGSSGPSATPRSPPPTGAATGGGSPGAKGDGPPPPPSREQRRRMSAAPLTEQQIQGMTSSHTGHAARAIVRAA